MAGAFMISFLKFAGRHARLVLALGVFLGLVLPGLGDYVGPALQILVVLLLATAMIRVDLLGVLSHLRKPAKIGGLLFILMLAMPLCVHAIATLLGLDPVLHLAVVLVACAPPLASAPSMAALLKLDDALVLNIMVLGTLMVPFTVPLIILNILDLPLDLDALSLLGRLVATIGAAILTAVLIRKFAGKDRLQRHHDLMDGISALIMLVFAIVIMNGIGLTGMTDGPKVRETLLVALSANWGVHLILLTLFILVSGFFGKGYVASPEKGAIALMASNRNAALFMAALPAETLSSLLLFMALAQLPIYLTPLVAAPLYRSVLDKREAMTN